MITKAESLPISIIFGIDDKHSYVIPKYQREYTWSKDNWEDLYNDISENINHFIGSIIYINDSENTYSIKELELVDGQQRLTTIAIFYCALYKKISAMENLDEDQNSDKNNLKYRIINKFDKKTPKIRLSSQNSNDSDFAYILKDIKLVESLDTSKFVGLRRIWKCYQFFQNKVESLDDIEVFKLLEKINNAIVVAILVSSHSEAFVLFESLNNRGIPLSPIDLIKNKLLSKAEKSKNNVDNIFNSWKQILENLTDDYTVQERFLRQFYNTYKHLDKIKIEGETKAIKSNLIKIYEKLIDQDFEFIFNELYTKSKIYNEITLGNTDDDELNNLLYELNHVKAAPAYILLMYLMGRTSGFDLDFMRKTVQLLIKYFIRRNIVDFPSTRDLDQIFINLVEELENHSKLDFNLIQNYLTDTKRTASLEIFQDKLAGDLYLENIDALRFILVSVEKHNSETKENKRDFWERDKNKRLVWTIEHIFPEGENISEKWVSMIAKGDSKKAKELQNKLVHKIGNLTLTAYNSNLSNYSFETKRDHHKEGKYIGYKNGLFLNRELANLESWSVENIEDRTKTLIQCIIDIYKFDHEGNQ